MQEVMFEVDDLNVVSKEFGQLVRTGNISVKEPNVEYVDRVVPIDKQSVNEVTREQEVPLNQEKV